MQLLLISNSTNAGEPYLEYCKKDIAEFLQSNNINNSLFIPYAAVTFSYDEYLTRVQEKLEEFGIEISSIHNHPNPKQAVEQAESIVVGGGNTFHLLKSIYDNELLEHIKNKVNSGTPYVGWSAGANLACPTIGTTNDMPIVYPPNLESFGFIPFQINPHYIDTHLEGHAGETREQRILEYTTTNPNKYVVGLRESCMLLLNKNKLQLKGNRHLRVFRNGLETKEYSSKDDIHFLMN